MSINIRPFTEDLTQAVIDFNQRLRAQNVGYRFPEHHVPAWLPKKKNRKIYQEYFLAVEQDVVRGAYILKHQEFSFGGKIVSIADYQLPLSEGIVDHRYNLLGIFMLQDGLRRQPLLFGLGMGSFEKPVAVIFKAMGWQMHLIPFYFKVNHPFQFLKHVSFLRKTKLQRISLDFLRYSGLGWGILQASHYLLPKGRSRNHPVALKPVADFSDWADHIWRACQDHYAMMARRDAESLNILYPATNPRFHRLQVSRRGEAVGWAVVLDTLMTAHKQFGGMRLGSIVDCLALPNFESQVMAGACKFLEDRGVDLIVSNQSHHAWGQALKNAGFIRGPSNFIFAAAKKLTHLLHPFELNKPRIHLNRGDGDGPINL
jgi:hypothetical protein